MPAMEPISEDEDEVKPSGCCLCCKSKKNNQAADRSAPAPAATSSPKTSSSPTNNNNNGNASNNIKARPRLGRSVYVSAKEILDEETLAALKAFEESVVASIAGGDETVYFSALEAAEAKSGETIDYAPAKAAERFSVISMDDPATLLSELKKGGQDDLPGYPGNLTDKELAACQQFRDELKKRKLDTANDGGIWEEVVRVFAPIETEPYALCRFLRARHFNVEHVFEMISGSLDTWRAAREHDFYPDPSKALGCPIHVLLSQLPKFVYGSAKNGCPVGYGRAKGLSVEGIEALTPLSTIDRYAWYMTLHQLKEVVAKSQKMNPDMVVRFETIEVIDLKGLTASMLNAQTMACLKNLFEVNKCFPEVLNAMVILNAPRFFSFFWKVIKTMMDARTASKINIFSDEAEGNAWLQEHIDSKQLLSDYGGTGPTYEAAMNMTNNTSTCKRQVVKLFAINHKTNDEMQFTLAADEKVSFTAYTKSAEGAGFVLKKGNKEVAATAVEGSKTKGTDGIHIPVSVSMFTGVRGPGDFVITSKGKGRPIHHFVVAGEVCSI